MLRPKKLILLSLFALGAIAIAEEGYRAPALKLKEVKTSDVDVKSSSLDERPRPKVQERPDAERMVASEEEKEGKSRDPKSEKEMMSDEIKKMEEERWGTPKEPSFSPTYWKYER